MDVDGAHASGAALARSARGGLRCVSRALTCGVPGVVRFTVSLAATADAPARTAIAAVPCGGGGAVACAALRSAAAEALGLRDLGALALTNGSVADICTDADAAALRPGDTLHLLPRGGGAEAPEPLCERINFPPHPKTLTDNGDCARPRRRAAAPRAVGCAARRAAAFRFRAGFALAG